MLGLKWVVQWKILELNVFGDSRLIINHVNDEYQTKDDKLLVYKRMVDDFKKYFTLITFEKILQQENKAIDSMVTIASLLDMEDTKARFEFLVEPMSYPSYDDPNTQIIG